MSSTWRPLAAVEFAQTAVGLFVFFGKDFDGGEVVFEAGAGEFVGLLGEVALCDGCSGGGRPDAGGVSATPRREFRSAVSRDGVSKAEDAVVLVGGEGPSVSSSKQAHEGRRKLLRP